MLTIKAEASAGCSLRDEMLPNMVRLARITGARVEVSGNDTKFWAMPDDTVTTMQDAFDRLYPTSSIVASCIGRPVPRRTIAATIIGDVDGGARDATDPAAKAGAEG